MHGSPTPDPRLPTPEMTALPQPFPTAVSHKSTFRLIVEPMAIAIGLAFLVRATLRLYVIPSSSMAPSLVAGDHIVVTPYRFGGQPRRGDVIVFRSPRSAEELMIKRVVGTPGDLVETRGGRVIVRGHAVAEPYVATQASTGFIAPQILPADCYYVLGDNRADSLDSRSWGVLPRAFVLGRARMILWSSQSGAGSRVSGVAAATPFLTPDSRLPASERLRSDRFFKWIE
jgi:signal peptidase I